MANDWIPMRVALRRDPKVVKMANFLVGQSDYLEWLGIDGDHRNVTAVTRNVCVGGLLEIWGVAREQGRREGDDLLVAECDLGSIDTIAGIPKFGEAMAEIRWAVEADGNVLRLPNYFEDKESPHERYRHQNAERQRRWRERQRGRGDEKAPGLGAGGTGPQGSNAPLRYNNVTDPLLYKEGSGSRSKRKKKDLTKVYQDAFERFWNAYPRRIAKKEASRVFARVVDGGADPDAVIEAAKLYNQAMAGTPKRFIRHPATWLNQGNYDDDPAEWEQNGTESQTQRGRIRTETYHVEGETV